MSLSHQAPGRSHTGSLVAALAILSMACALVGGLVGPELANGTVFAGVVAFPALGWVGDVLMRLFSFFVVSVPTAGHPMVDGRVGRAAFALVCGAIPALILLLKSRSDHRFRVASFRGACVSLAASVRATVSRGASPVAAVAHGFLASRGLGSDPFAPAAPERVAEPDFAEAESAAAAMLGRLAQRETAR